jgi:hypothetical protein
LNFGLGKNGWMDGRMECDVLLVVKDGSDDHAALRV